MVPKKPKTHHAYDEDANEAPKLIEDEPVEVERDLPDDEPAPIEDSGHEEEPIPPLFEE